MVKVWSCSRCRRLCVQIPDLEGLDKEAVIISVILNNIMILLNFTVSECYYTFYSIILVTFSCPLMSIRMYVNYSNFNK